MSSERVVQCVCCHGVEKLGDLRAEREFWGWNGRFRERGCGDEVGFGAFDVVGGVGIIPYAEAACASAFFWGLVLSERLGKAEGVLVDHPYVEQ